MRTEISSILKPGVFKFKEGENQWFSIVIDNVDYGCLRVEDFEQLKADNGPLMYQGYNCDSTQELWWIAFKVLRTIKISEAVHNLPKGEGKEIPPAIRKLMEESAKNKTK